MCTHERPQQSHMNGTLSQHFVSQAKSQSLAIQDYESIHIATPCPNGTLYVNWHSFLSLTLTQRSIIAKRLNLEEGGSNPHSPWYSPLAPRVGNLHSA